MILDTFELTANQFFSQRELITVIYKKITHIFVRFATILIWLGIYRESTFAQIAAITFCVSTNWGLNSATNWDRKANECVLKDICYQTEKDAG